MIVLVVNQNDIAIFKSKGLFAEKIGMSAGAFKANYTLFDVLFSNFTSRLN
ncbi:hypothetical protein C8D83_1011115 [Halothiobacillus neapolitanus]|nr:hypothetical protein C8D83_1011115 [Halothiobacillus neapolitanus]